MMTNDCQWHLEGIKNVLVAAGQDGLLTAGTGRTWTQTMDDGGAWDVDICVLSPRYVSFVCFLLFYWPLLFTSTPCVWQKWHQHYYQHALPPSLHQCPQCPWKGVAIVWAVACHNDERQVGMGEGQGLPHKHQCLSGNFLVYYNMYVIKNC